MKLSLSIGEVALVAIAVALWVMFLWGTDVL
jgi:hypothetical protein